MLLNRRLSLLCLCLISKVVMAASAGWGDYWPISGLTTIPTNSTYSNYLGDLYFAADERARATVNGTNTRPEVVRTGGTLAYQVVPRSAYAVSPFVWAPHVPWYAGVTNADVYGAVDGKLIRTSEQRSIRTSVTLTNGIWVTNRTVALVPLPDSSIMTNVLSQARTYVSTQCSTNVLYSTVHTNKIPYAKWVATGAAWDLLKPGMYTTPEGIYWTGADYPLVFDALSTTYTLNAPDDSDPPLYSWGATQGVFAVTTNIPFYLANPDHTFSSVVVSVTATNYTFEYTNAVVARIPTYTSASDSTPMSYTPDQSITLTNVYKVITNDFSWAADTLLINLVGQISACVPYYYVTTNADNTGSFQNFLDTVGTWKWLGGHGTPADTWTNEPWGMLYGPFEYPVPYVPDVYLRTYTEAVPLPRWDLPTFVNVTGAGTNLYRLDIKVNSLIYPSLTSGSYSAQVGPINYTVPSWTLGDYTTYTTAQSTDMRVVTNDNPQFLCYPASTMRVVLASYETKPLYEKSVKCSGFSSIYWGPVTNAAVPATVTNVQFMPVRQYVTNFTWLSSLNGETLYRQTYSDIYTSVWGDYYESLLPYYTDGAVYIMPLVSGVRATIDAQEDTSEWWTSLYYVTNEYATSGWFITTNRTAGLDIALNWSTLFGTNMSQVAYVLQSMGYPTRVSPSRIGYQSLGASGYYYPAGVIRADTYAVGVVPKIGFRPFTGWDADHSAPYWLEAAQAIPYDLTYMTWDILADWPNTLVEVSKATPYTTTIPEFTVGVTGRVMYSDMNRAINGYTNVVVGIETFNVTAPGESQLNSQFINCLLTNDNMLAYPDMEPKQILTWTRDAVWNCRSSSVTDNYYTAALLTVSTNKLPALLPAQEILAVDRTISAAGTEISIVCSNAVTMYSSTAGYINPGALDACYNAINALKYAAVTPAVYTEYPGWTSDQLDTAFGKVATEFKDVTHDVRTGAGAHDITTTRIDINVAATGANILDGPHVYTNAVYPEWTVYDNSWYVSGSGWLFYDHLSAIRDDAAQTYHRVYSGHSPDFTDTVDRNVTRNAIGFRAYTIYQNYDGTYESLALAQASFPNKLGRWAKNVDMVIPNDTQLVSSVTMYTGVSFNFGSVSDNTMYTNKDVDVVSDLVGSHVHLIGYTNTAYHPLAIETNNIVKNYAYTFSPDNLTLIYTNLFDLAGMVMQLDTFDMNTWHDTYTDSYTYPDDEATASHAFDFTATAFKPYSYKMRTVEGVRIPAFKYHN